MLDKGRAFSTIKVYLATISACHVGFSNTPAGHHTLICWFMKGACRLLPVVKSLVPSWDVSIVLEAILQQPFDQLDTVDMTFLLFKTTQSSAKREICTQIARSFLVHSRGHCPDLVALELPRFHLTLV